MQRLRKVSQRFGWVSNNLPCSPARTHHGKGRDAVWIKSTHITQASLVKANPDQPFLPPYVAHLGWIGLWLVDVAAWDEASDLLHEGYRLTAPKRLLR
jgi:hypothetical protein